MLSLSKVRLICVLEQNFNDPTRTVYFFIFCKLYDLNFYVAHNHVTAICN